MYYSFPSSHRRLISGKENVILLETSRWDAENYRSYLFVDPIETLQIHSPDQMPGLLDAIERRLKQNLHVAGFFGYECGFQFERIAPTVPSMAPIAYFGVYPQPLIFNHITGSFENEHLFHHRTREASPPGTEDCTLANMRLDISYDEFERAHHRIHRYIHEGETYQINFTTRYRFDVHGSPLALYEQLTERQPVAYNAFINANGRTILCHSPELFFRLKDGHITTRPMKGTVGRGRTCEEDRSLMHWLGNDAKNKAENVMIVDLLRNDLGRVCETGSVETTQLFDVEPYRTLHQMTSTVTGRLRPGISYYDLFKSIFPSGSVTGAPKIRAMQIIHELETAPRGVYTGAIGFFSPAAEAVFNVAIRTLEIEGTSGVMGVGSGVVADSMPEQEYAECRLKAQFVAGPSPEFDLIETMLWDGQLRLLDKHLKRLYDSAMYFDYPCDIDNLKNTLVEKCRHLISGSNYKVRLLLNRSGVATIQHTPVTENSVPHQGVVRFADVRTDSHNVFLYHKTTQRHLYEESFQIARQEGLEDFIFRNEKGEVTEGAVSNIVIRSGRSLYTPPLECGLLSGVYRQYLLETNPNLSEKILVEKDIREADAVFVCNAVRGMREVRVLEAPMP